MKPPPWHNLTCEAVGTLRGAYSGRNRGISMATSAEISLTLDQRIVDTDKGADISLDTFMAFLSSHHSPALPEAEVIYARCVEARVSVAAMCGMFLRESTCGTQGTATITKSWGNTRQTYQNGDRTSPIYFGSPPITEARAEKNNAGEWIAGAYPVLVSGRSGEFPKFATWADGASATFWRLASRDYVYAGLGRYTLAQIIPVWAPSSDLNDPTGYARGVAVTMLELYAAESAKAAETPQREGTKLVRLALSSGHHNTDGGDPFEVSQTGELCAAMAKRARELGIDVRVVQPDDGRGMVPYGLQPVAQKVVDWSNAGWTPDYYFETHTEGGGGTGVFVIYPDWSGDVDTDTRDVLGPAIARAVAKATGLGLGAGGDGVMSERYTGVGAGGSRLGVFLRSAPLAASTTRGIIEFGAHDKQPDVSIQKSAGFFAKAGAAAAEAIAAHAGIAIVASPGEVVAQNKPAQPSAGFVVHPVFSGFYTPSLHGAPLGPGCMYTDGVIRQLFENVTLGAYQNGNRRIEGLGQAYTHGTGKNIPDWPTVHPLLP